MSTRALVGIVAVAGALWLLRRPLASGSVSALALAISKAEGYGIPGAIPTRANNPGNLKLGAPTLERTGITVFATPAEGWAALERQISLILSGRSAHYNAGMTIAQMGAKWAPAGDNNITGAWASNVARSLGVSTSATIRSVTA